MSRNAPICNRNVHISAHFCYKMVHYGIFVQYIVGFVRQVYGKVSIRLVSGCLWLSGAGRARVGIIRDIRFDS